jgi:xanthine/uracil permease
MRYGRQRHLSPAQKYAATTVALLLGVLVAYLVFRNSEPTVVGVVDNFQVTSSTKVVVNFEVHRPASMAVVCVVRARDAAGAEVGRANVTVPPGDKITHVPYTLTTTGQAVTGEVEDCAQADG